MRKWQNARKQHTQENQEVSPFPAGDHKLKTARNRQDRMTDKRETQIYKNNPEKKYHTASILWDIDK